MDQLLAIRIKDGLFVGNAVASADEDFLTLNKVTHIVNCVASTVPNRPLPGVHFLNFDWPDGHDTTLFQSPRDVRQVRDFIDEALAPGACALIHSVDGLNRACAMATAYMMAKYGWCMSSAYEFVCLAHGEAEIRQSYLAQLKELDKAFAIHDEYDVLHPQLDPTGFALDNEQWCLRNTYLNALPADHERNDDLQRHIAARSSGNNYNNVKLRRRPHDKRVLTFATSNAPPYTPPATGSILKLEPVALKHSLESPDGVTCPMGPWKIRGKHDPTGYVRKAAEKPAHVDPLTMLVTESQASLVKTISSSTNTTPLSGSVGPRFSTVKAEAPSSKKKRPSRTATRGESQFTRKNSPMPSRPMATVTRGRKEASHTDVFVSPAIARIQGLRGVGSLPFKAKDSPRTASPRDRVQQKLSPRGFPAAPHGGGGAASGRTSPRKQRNAASQEYPAPLRAMLNPTPDLRRPVMRTTSPAGGLRNNSPTDRLFRQKQAIPMRPRLRAV
ncbi:Dual specificity protein phosphatase 1 [Diplonema papillatum]|nr:Dual specificity protein phosphatase 1 [Diplonema papillatum]